MPWERAILHVDMDAFFASVEQRDFPEYRGKPVLVGGTRQRGVVCAASYEARVFGCRSAMPMSRAVALCPLAIVLKPRFQAYREASEIVFRTLHEFSPLVETLSSDEAFLDITGSQRLLGEPVAIAQGIRRLVRERTRLTCSVGVAPNKFLAKLGSDLNKPDGLTVLGPDPLEIVARLAPLPISRLWGVGPKAEARLNSRGLRTFGDIAARGEAWLVEAFGEFGLHLFRLSRGVDDRPVVSEREAKSIGHEETFFDNLDDPEEMRQTLLAQVEHVCRRLRRHGLKARTVTLKLRSPRFETITRAGSLIEATDSTDAVWAMARSLLAAWMESTKFGPLRLLGVQLSGLSGEGGEGQQLDLFGASPADPKKSAAEKAADEIARRFGAGAITRGGAMGKKKR